MSRAVAVRAAPSSPAATARMRATRQRDTDAERALRSELHRRGYRFRVDYPIRDAGVRTRPDVVFTRCRVAVYVDGCFWHRCPIHGSEPQANSAYWKPKLDANVRRDQRISLELEARGWRVVRVWAHQAADEAADEVVEAVSSSIR